MKFSAIFLTVLLPVIFSTVTFAADTTALAPFLVTNDDLIIDFPPTTATFYPIAADGTLSTPTLVHLHGNGMAGGYFASTKVLVVPDGPDACVYASNSQSGGVAGMVASTRTLTGDFLGSLPDQDQNPNGVAIAASANYLYGAFSGLGKIGTYQILPGCKLKFVGDLHSQGLNNGIINAMAITGSMLVVAYGDGSIESFNISGGIPVSNGDAQLSTGSATDYLPDAVDITRDGHYAIFGDAANVTTVEVSDISSGQLTPTVVYTLGTAWNSGGVRLSPDESILYISNTSGGRVTAAYFDKTTGEVTPGCTSDPLKGFYRDFAYAGGVVSQLPTGTGGLLYVAEFGSGSKSYIGILQFTTTGTSCSFTEVAGSHVAGSHMSALLSIAVYPPRPF